MDHIRKQNPNISTLDDEWWTGSSSYTYRIYVSIEKRKVFSFYIQTYYSTCPKYFKYLDFTWTYTNISWICLVGLDRKDIKKLKSGYEAYLLRSINTKIPLSKKHHLHLNKVFSPFWILIFGYLLNSLSNATV